MSYIFILLLQQWKIQVTVKKHLVPKIKLLLVQEGSNYVVENTRLLAIDLN